MTTYTRLCHSRKHHKAVTAIRDRAEALHASVRAERESAYGADVPIAYQVLLDEADDALGALCNAADVLSREISIDERRKLDPTKGQRAA